MLFRFSSFIGICRARIGNYIRAESALRIGLLPKVPLERIRFVGNAACSGAKMILLSKTLRENAKRIAASIEYIELAARPEFQNLFSDHMFFPHT